jgi:hypothetical protein
MSLHTFDDSVTDESLYYLYRDAWGLIAPQSLHLQYILPVNLDAFLRHAKNRYSTKSPDAQLDVTRGTTNYNVAADAPLLVNYQMDYSPKQP